MEPNFYVEVMNRQQARKFTYESHDFSTIIISITDVESNPNSFKHDKSNGVVAICPIKFDDVNRGSINCITKEDARKIARFVMRHINTQKCVDHVLVHCEAGKSRSAGVAAAILKFYYGNDMQIYGNPKYTPNSTCYSMVLEAFYDCEDEDEQKG